jgi:hypothetical protein
MATGDDDADRFRVPRWISGPDPEDGELADGSPTTEDFRSPPYDGDEAEPYIAGAQTPALTAGEPIWPVPERLPERISLPPPVTRGQREAAEPHRRGLIIVVVAAVVVVIVTVALLIRGATGGGKTPAADAGQTTAGATEPAGPAGPAGPTPTGPSASPGTPGASGSAGTGPSTGATGAGQTGAPAAPAFGPLTIEAENPGNTLLGSAHIVDYPDASGGRVVQNIGEWGLDAGRGTLRFNNVDVPRTGNYTLTFSYVDIDNEATRTAVIDISGRTGLVITVHGDDKCCRRQTVQVRLDKGRNTISFSNRTSHAPSIDKIVITAP